MPFRRATSAARAHFATPHFRETYYLTANGLVLAAGGFFFWLVASRFASAATVGQAAAVVSAASLVQTLGRLGLDYVILRRIPSLDTHGRIALVQSTTAVTLAATLVVGTIFFAAMPLWTRELELLRGSAWAVAGFLGLCISLSLARAADPLLAGLRTAGTTLIKNTSASIIRVAAILVSVRRLDVAVVAGAFGMGGFLPGAWAFWRVDRRHAPGLLRRWTASLVGLRSLGGEAFAHLLIGFALVAPVTVGTLLVLSTHGPEASGVYYILWLFGNLSIIASLALGQSLTVERVHAGEITPQTHWIGLLVTGLIGLAAAVMGTLFLPLFGQTSASLGLRELLPFGIAAFPISFLEGRYAKLRVEKRFATLATITLVPAVLFLAGLPLVQPALAGWLWLVSNTALAVILLALWPASQQTTTDLP